jgi:HEAT repeat protein
MAWLTSLRLKSTNPQVRLRALENLAGSANSKDTEIFLASLSDRNPQVRCAAIRALEKVRGETSAKSLIGALGDPIYEVREAAARALGRLRLPGSTEALAAALRDPDAAVRAAAAGALRALAWRPSTSEESARFEIALGNTTASSSVGEMTVDPIEPRQDTAFLRRAAAEARKERDDPRRIKLLLASLQDSDPTVRASAVHDLGHLTDESVTRELLNLFRDRDSHVRHAAAQVLAKRNDSPPGHFLGLLGDTDGEVRLVAVQFLGRIRHPQIAQVLLPLLSDSQVDVRQAAAAALGQIGNASSLESLIVTLTDEDPLVRQAAEQALSQIDSEWVRSEAARDARARLEQLVNDRPPEMRLIILQLLEILPAAGSPQELVQSESHGA